MVTCHTTPNLGSFLGNKGGQRLVDELNFRLSANGGGTVFAQNSSSSINERMQMFISNVIEPERVATEQFMEVIGNTFIDAIRPIVSVEDLEQGIPLSMHEAIVTFEPIKTLLTAEEVYGFGYRAVDLPKEDRIGRLINNGMVDLSEPPPEGGYEMVWEWDLDDPDLTLDELDHIERTRNWMDKFIKQTKFDPTSYPDERGKLKD